MCEIIVLTRAKTFKKYSLTEFHYAIMYYTKLKYDALQFGFPHIEELIFQNLEERFYKYILYLMSNGSWNYKLMELISIALSHILNFAPMANSNKK